MLTAITHEPSPSIHNCELTFLESEKIDFERAKAQHKNYCEMLAKCGAEVSVLDGNIELPDSVFVEDTAIVLDEIAIITPMGIFSRQKETELIEKELRKSHKTKIIRSPAKIEGGDVLQIEKNLYVGLSTRTNAEGIEALRKIVEPLGYIVFAMQIRGALHLKTACTSLNNKTVLMNPDWVDSANFKDLTKIEVSQDEPFASNILKINDIILIHSGFAKTKQTIEGLGFKTQKIDISEFLKAEAGVTCLSLIF